MGQTDSSKALCAEPAEAMRWPYLLTNEDKPRKLMPFATLLRKVSDRDELPPRRAAGKACDAFFGAERREWFLLHESDDPRPLDDSTVWRQALKSGEQILREFDVQDDCDEDDSVVIISAALGRNHMPIAEALQRGLIVDVSGCDPELGLFMQDAEWLAVPELPELRGVAGLETWIRSQWVDRRVGWHEIDQAGDLAALAVLESDAAALMGLVSEAVVVKFAKPALAAIPSIWPHAKGEKWTDEQLSALRTMCENDEAWAQMEFTTGATKAQMESALKEFFGVASKKGLKALTATQRRLGHHDTGMR